MKTLVAVLAFTLLLSRAAIGDAQSQLQIKPKQAPGKPTLEIPVLLAPFMGCWYGSDTHEIVESRTATGALALPTKSTGGGLFFCWKTGSDGAVYFQPPSGGYFPLREEDRQIGIVSWWSDYNTNWKVDPGDRRVRLEGRSILRYVNNREVEEETIQRCLPEGSEMECIQQYTTNWNHEPWYTEVDHFHMQRVSCGSEMECVKAGVKINGR
jgi:hypothetical protein